MQVCSRHFGAIGSALTGMEPLRTTRASPTGGAGCQGVGTVDRGKRMLILWETPGHASGVCGLMPWVGLVRQHSEPRIARDGLWLEQA